MEKKGFMKLTGNELKSLEGMLAIIELQEGCPHRCLGCGTDAKKPGDSMGYEDVLDISKSIEHVRDEKGIELLMQDLGGELMFFYGSDPAYYHSYSNGVEKTILDVGKEFYSRHGKQMTFTTAGWKPGDNHMEMAMRQIAENNRKGKKQITSYIGYSIKPFGILIRKEYERFCNRLLASVFDMKKDIIMDRYGGHADQIVLFKGNFPKDKKNYVDCVNMAEWEWLIKEHLTDFFKESRYVRQLLENMKTLQGAEVNYCCQWLGSRSDYPESLPKQNKKYEFLLSGEFKGNLADYCSQNAGKEISVSWGWCWKGVGRAKTELGLKPVALEQVRIADIEHGKDDNGDLFARVLFDGTINIMYGQSDDMTSVYVPERYFSRMAESFRDKDSVKSAHYRTLANLQGRNILT